MPRHKSVTDEYEDELRARLRAAGGEPGRGPVNNGVCRYLRALRRADQGWTRVEIEAEIVTRRLLGVS